MKSTNVNGTIYYIESVPFEDKSEQDEEGYYEYFYKGVNLSFHSDKEKIIYFLKNPSLAFGKDFEAIKIYIIKEFDVNTFKIPGGEKAYIEL
ncbi:hypothetical protein JDS91_22395 [Bacillus cereus]|uniref:hypothetical protein n=1 Tax=Bacillus cereus TaxID=1396 RepID=UPI0018F368F5|nr:hypothetical protein [Bacillus cereus]MCU4824838.1 hypothetical protein [Bacillus cereus]MCU4857777.1 hypothetical protein [Bacillus cereus]MCU4875140.1 hypothetical protein [Bacillus cereus]MCU4941164.1 hypothetical protein [Bacillus cereus]